LRIDSIRAVDIELTFNDYANATIIIVTSVLPMFILGGSAIAFPPLKLHAVKNYSSDRHFLDSIFCS
jgi:hypothetical protein